MAKFTKLFKKFPPSNRIHWSKRKAFAMLSFRRRHNAYIAGLTPITSPEVEIQAENGDFLFSEAGSYIITE